MERLVRKIAGEWTEVSNGPLIVDGILHSQQGLRAWARRAPDKLEALGVHALILPDPAPGEVVNFEIEEVAGRPVARNVDVIDRALSESLVLREKLEAIGVAVPTEEEAKDEYEGRRGGVSPTRPRAGE